MNIKRKMLHFKEAVTVVMYLDCEIVASFFVWIVNCCETDKWDGHGFVPMATPVCSRHWGGSHSQIFPNRAFGSSRQVSFSGEGRGRI
jgi:hypothetical protein